MPDALSAAKRWMLEAPRQLVEFQRACALQVNVADLREFEELGRKLESEIHIYAGEAAKAAISAGVEGAVLADVLASDAPPNGEHLDILITAKDTRVIADQLQSTWKQLIEDAAEIWICSDGGGFPGHPILGVGLRLLRKRAGLSQDELAGRLQVSKPFISHIENFRRERKASVEMVAAWTEACSRPLQLRLRPAQPHRLSALLEQWSSLPLEARSLVEASIATALKDNQGESS